MYILISNSDRVKLCKTLDEQKHSLLCILILKLDNNKII